MVRILTITAWFIIIILSNTNIFAQGTIKVACVGNSVTYGAGIKDRELNSYPAQLQKLLGEAYTVKNFGHSGATLLRKGHHPYYLTDEFKEVVRFDADIAVIHLGLNDTDPRNWPNYRLDFKRDYSWLIDTLRVSNPKMEIHVAILSPIFSGHPRFKSGTRDWHSEIREQIIELSKANNVYLIDFYQPFISRPDLFPDQVHPNKEGAKIMAERVYANLKNDFGGLRMTSIFGDGMVLQRGDSIPVFGKGDPGKLVEVSLYDKSAKVKVDPQGEWMVYLKDIAVGGPYKLSIQQEDQILNYTDVMVGDVWLCMGQSNMAFPLNSSVSWAEESLSKEETNMRLFQYLPNKETNNASWDSLTLTQVNELSYFTSKWNVDKSGFSAVSYHFGKELSKEVVVPIGIIQLALGGAPIESFISREVLMKDDLLVDMLHDWENSDFIMPWVRERAKVNLSSKWNSTQRHPYEPSYIYDAALRKIIPFGIKGILWYQGESNAHNPELYVRQFQAMIEDYRLKWKNLTLPIYFVQLPSLARPSWPTFRNMQQELNYTLPNSHMIVTLDLGDSLDVHPKAKKEVGRRLALSAMGNGYGMEVLSKGPELEHIKFNGDKLVLIFKNAGSLQTNNGGPVLGFELLSDQGKRFPVIGRIEKDTVVLPVPDNILLSKVLYGFEPFSRGNLVNEANLPLGTSEYKIEK
ncbi:GDSL-type esterase/lipase family protein [Echinicola shivajiensis]|uniref:GDSL-type esterase/lipase family protein n=1 Tax=Echinicola shivajiensis TaxID=1035916 RepID=UPI001BFC5A30|nr:GDSL-type esterase/lipase family protein [Echinicola shivajiensis]